MPIRIRAIAPSLFAASLALAAPALPAQGNPPLPGIESSAPVATAALSGAPLLAALKRGGHVVYFRHAATDFSRGDSAMKSYADCANQRPLSAQGRQDAQAIGAAIVSLRLPVGERMASPFCRTLEHARLMLGEAAPQRDILGAKGDGYEGLKRLLAAPVAAGSNRWIVGHGSPFLAVAGPPRLAEGEAAVIRPEGTGWTVVARLAVADWQALAAAR